MHDYVSNMEKNKAKNNNKRIERWIWRYFKAMRKAKAKEMRKFIHFLASNDALFSW